MLVVCMFLGVPLLIWGSYLHWKGHSDSADYPRSFAGFMLRNVDMAMAIAGGIALAFLLDAFEVEDTYIATAVFAMIKGGICVLIGLGVLLMLMRSQEGFWRKVIVYGCVLALISLSVARHQDEKQRAAEAPKRPIVLPR